ncbi:MAG: hypothetical protein ACN6QH_05420 [Pseudomonas sp.]|uniref:hypothetical protein n=1 Tax=Pseudomonas sp. TaxID=306 RepID=UPI003D122F96
MSNDVHAPAAAGSALLQFTRWDGWFAEFWQAPVSFAEVAREHLMVHLRTYYPEGQAAPSFIQTLFYAVLQRLIDGQVVAYDPDQHSDLLWEVPEQEQPSERYEVLVQVIEGVACSVLDTYQQALAARWAARPATLQQVEGVGRMFEQRLQAHLDAIEALFQPQRLEQLDAVALEQCIEELERDWRESFAAGAGLPAENRSRVKRLTRSALGDWFAALGEPERALLSGFQAHSEALQEQIRHQLVDVASLSAHATHAIGNYVRATLGVDIRPEAVQVLTRSDADSFSASRTLSLSQLVAEGPFLPDPGKSRQMVDDAGMHLGALLTSGFLDDLLQHVDARGGYLQQLEACYRNPELTDALIELLDVRVQQSAFVGRCQGHLSQSSYERVLRIRQQAEAGEVVGVSLFPDLPLAGLLLFFTKSPQGEVDGLILYAPDKPDGQEWIELPSLRQVAQELGGWLKDEPGRTYLLGLVDVVERVRAEQFFAEVVERADKWDLDRDHRGCVRGYRACCEQAVELRKAHHLRYADVVEAPRWFSELTVQERQRIAGLNEDLRLLDIALQQQVAEQETFEAFAKRTVQSDVAPYLQERGVTEAVDPQTILFDFRPGLSGRNPRVTRSLLDLAMYGYDDNWGLDDPLMPVRSSVDQDLGALRAAELTQYVRRAYLGERYTDSVRSRFLDPAAPLYALRRSIQSKLTRTRMLRDVSVAQGKKMIDASQSSALAAAIARLAPGQPADTGPGGLFRFALNARPGVGLYLFRLIEGERIHDWLYTPEAPDGLPFRKYQSFAGAWPGAMHAYYLARLRYADREAGARCLQRLAKGEVVRDDAGSFKRIDDFLAEYDDYLQSHIDDVEAVTKSRHEVVMEIVSKGLLYAAIPVCMAFPPLGVALDLVFVAVTVRKAVQAHLDDDDAGARQHWLTVAVLLWGLALPKAWAMFRSAVWGAPKRVAPLLCPPRPMPGPTRQGTAETGLVIDSRQALKKAPDNLVAMTAQGVWKDVYSSSSAAGTTWYVRQNKRFFQVVHDADNATLRLIDPRFPTAQYRMPIRQDGWGRWVFNNQVGLRGGGQDVRYLGRVSRAAEAFPARTNPLPARGALQGEGVIAGFRAGASDNYLYSLNAQSCVVVTLYNPATRMGAVIHVDHNIRALLENSLDTALVRIGRPSADQLKATLVGGDWLSGGADIGGPLKSILAGKGVTPVWDHWSYSSCFGNNYGVALDLASGATTVFTTTRSAVAEVVDPLLREATAGGTSLIAQRGRRFIARFRQEPLVQRADGTVRTPSGEVASAAKINEQAVMLHLLAD